MSNESTTHCYVILRKELSHEAALVHAAHAARECGYSSLLVATAELGVPEPTEDENLIVLGATAEELQRASEELTAAGVPHRRCTEIHGPLASMAGGMPSIGLAVANVTRETLVQPLLQTKLGLKLFRFSRPTADSVHQVLKRLGSDRERREFLDGLRVCLGCGGLSHRTVDCTA